MKKSELRQIIREELLKENTVDVIMDEFEEMLMNDGIHIKNFEIAKDEGDFDIGPYKQLERRWAEVEKHVYGYLRLVSKFRKQIR